MPGARGTRMLLERESELAALDDALDSALDGRGSLTLVQGPAGIGKSELLAVAGARAADRGADVLAARGGEFERSFGFGIARQLLEPRLAGADDAEQNALLEGSAALAAPALSLAGVEPPPGPAGPPIGDPAGAIQHGLYWLVANLAERAPLLIAIDDLQWADSESARWLLYLTRRVSDLPVAIVAAVRSGEPGLDPELLAALEREDASRAIRPETLSEEAAVELVRSELGPDAEADFCSAAHRASGGNPFLLHELMEAVRSEEIQPTAESAHLIVELRPETVSRSVMVRLGRLPEGAGSLTSAVAILGDGAIPRRAGALAGLSPDSVASAADLLADAAILARGETLGFAHPLIRAAVYAEIPSAQRALSHSQAARLLAGDEATPEEVASQLLHSEPGADPDALQTLRAAAASAVSRAAPDAAVAYLRRAFAEPGAATVRPMLIAELLTAGTRAGNLSALDEISEDPVAELMADEEAFQACGPNLAVWAFLKGKIAEMTEVIELGIEIYRRKGDDAMALRQESLAMSVIDVKPPEAVARLESYADRLEPGTQEERAWLAMRGWWQHFVGGPAGESVELVRRGLDQGQLLDVENLGPAFSQAVLVLLRADELDEAERWIDLLSEDARRREPAYAVSTFGLRSWLAYRHGDLRSAEEDAWRAVEICREQRVALALAVNMRWLLDVLIEEGRLDEAESQLAANGLDGPLPDFWWFVPLLMARARLRIAAARAEEGIADLRDLLRRFESTRPASEPIASTLALALHALARDPDEVRRLLDWELEAAREWGTPRALGVALRAMGLVEGGERGIELLVESVDALRSSPARLELARSLTDLGAALRRANRRKDARGSLREGLELAHRCGATAIADLAMEELSASGAKPRRMMLTGVESLTPSELRVARLAARGMINREIAQELFVSVKTVETHLGSAYRKLDISSRRELPAALEVQPDELRHEGRPQRPQG